MPTSPGVRPPRAQHRASFPAMPTSHTSSQSFNFSTWGKTSNSNSDLSSPLDEFGAQPGRLSTLSPNISNPIQTPPLEAISPVFIEMVGHEYNLTEVQISNICALYHVCILPV